MEMSKYLVKQHSDIILKQHSDIILDYKIYSIYKKCWYGWSLQIRSDNATDVSIMISNLKALGNNVEKHWTVTTNLVVI